MCFITNSFWKRLAAAVQLRGIKITHTMTTRSSLYTGMQQNARSILKHRDWDWAPGTVSMWSGMKIAPEGHRERQVLRVAFSAAKRRDRTTVTLHRTWGYHVEKCISVHMAFSSKWGWLHTSHPLLLGKQSQSCTGCQVGMLLRRSGCVVAGSCGWHPAGMMWHVAHPGRQQESQQEGHLCLHSSAAHIYCPNKHSHSGAIVVFFIVNVICM